MIHVEEKRLQIIEAQTRYIARNIDEAILSNSYAIINVMGVTRETAGEEALIQDILSSLNVSMQGLSAARATFSTSVGLLKALMTIGEQPTRPDHDSTSIRDRI
ncbi:hypothetical protein [Novosphingobium sp.]|uniref:hypothetical protein n=1 Tax=Novosphingobium sp. TaxID=1874826 RepID=UPI0038B83B7B